MFQFRRFYDGSGGNNHAVEHYSAVGYPLAVKLGTITKDGKADVYSYSEDDMVEDPNLIEHLAHWGELKLGLKYLLFHLFFFFLGINIANMEKTEKSMIELELELNQKTNEWSALQESDGKLKPLYGPGYTGMVNMGNSCYLNSIIQSIFLIPDFVNKYYDGAERIFENATGALIDPAEDLNVQM